MIFGSPDWKDVWNYVRRPDQRITLAIPELLEQLRQLPDTTPGWTTEEFPFVLSAGERRSFTANTIYGDPTWRRRDSAGALRINPDDAARLHLTDGDLARITTHTGTAIAPIEVTDMMQPGHLSLPNGMGVDHPDHALVGVAPNELTSIHSRDAFAGTPWHKYVPAQVEKAGVAAS